jgi:uncharacterized protein (TIGR02421 family)
MKTPTRLSDYQQIVKTLSDKIVRAQRPIRLLEAVRWGDDVKREFFRDQCKKLPNVNANYYKARPLKYDLDEKMQEFDALEVEIRTKLGQFSGVSQIMQRMCREYAQSMQMLKARGTPDFAKHSKQLYGSSCDAFYAGAPTLRDLGVMVADTLENICNSAGTIQDKKTHSAAQAARILQTRLRDYFTDPADNIRAQSSTTIMSDAAAGAEQIKLNAQVSFSDRQIRQLEVHEGWVHLGTTLNGLAQPICTFLSKGPPSSTVSQEGLAILMEILTLSSYPSRVQRINNRIIAIDMAENGADFIDVFRFFQTHHLNDSESFNFAARVFRGSTPSGKPFTKDLAYTKGFVSIYNYIRLAVQRGLLSHIPLLFVGKTTLGDLRTISDLVEEGLVVAPKYVPKIFKDPAALSAWAAYSLFISQLDTDKIAGDFRDLLRGS